ncbi:MAG: molecular chaperone HtpG [Oscillospiraceae bacterium]|nr:molecular chaperone HtpG [Oscillospiraceae bacterium]
MATKQFKAESKRLLDLMIHSIYTHKEIFLRELISNASDAIDKLYYRALSENITGLSRDNFAISLAVDKENRILTVSDNGCGMTREELENNLGTIAKSGSLAFKKENEAKEDIDIIGQFGVGFYAAFMVADEVKVISRSYQGDDAWCWQSTGSEGYTLSPAEKESHGTDIILKIKDSTDEESYDEFLDQYRIEGLVKKYSDYIRYPIKMEKTKSRKKEDSDEYESYCEVETLNSMVPIWKKNKSEVSHEDYCQFYKDKFFDYNDPLRVIHSSTEGASTYNALLFIPEKPAFDYYSRDFEKGLQLYASGVLIMDKCADLLPDCFSFVRGLVDSQDLSLNISREMLQHDRQLKLIESRLEKKIKSELLAMLKNDREKYETFWNGFGRQLKYGLYSSYGAKSELLSDLLLFYSSNEKKLTTLEEYIGRMPEGQKYLYYACGDSLDRIDQLPQAELVKDKGYEILYFTEDVDEFVTKMMPTYKEKEFRSISSEDLGLESDEEKEASQKQQEENKDLFGAIQAALGDRVTEVRLSSRLKNAACCLTAKGQVSLEMERVLGAMPGEQKVKAERVLELNPEHEMFPILQKLYPDEKDVLADYAELLYGQALIREGMLPEDPAAFSAVLCRLMEHKEK